MIAILPSETLINKIKVSFGRMLVEFSFTAYSVIFLIEGSVHFGLFEKCEKIILS
jgi:hypothetical protein